jgi:hypothetical protein
MEAVSLTNPWISFEYNKFELVYRAMDALSVFGRS